MVKSAKQQTAVAVATVGDRSLKTRPSRSADVTGSDVARRSYELYLARGCAHGHDLDDWLQAERELRQPSTAV